MTNKKQIKKAWAWVLMAIMVVTLAVPALSTKAVAATTNQILNITTDGISSSFYTISGSTSDSKGTVTYNGLTLTKCLKIESSTKVSFTADAKGTLTLVFNSNFTGGINIDGKTYTAKAGIVTVDLAAGSHTITKKDVANLYYISFSSDSGSTTAPTTAPTVAPTQAPTTAPTVAPTQAPTEKPTTAPTTAPTVKPTEAPTSGTVTGSETGMYTNLSTKKDADFANAIYVSPSGSSSAAGTKSAPKDLESALTAVNPGQAIILLSGTYSYNKQITIAYTNSGTSSAYKVLRAADGANVVLDFSSQPYGDTATNARGIQLEGNYWYFYNLTVKGSADNGIYLTGSNNIIEKCVLQGNRDTGLQISRRAASLTDMKDWPSNNYILNCTSFNNADPATYENADGFAAKLTCGQGNVFDGCIAYCNSDDGWDLYAKEETGSIGVVTIRNCVAFNNGKLTTGSSFANGDMNGFKLGGSNGVVPTNHVVSNCLAFGNGKDGFTDNGNGGALSLTNCTSVGNAKINFNFYRTNKGIFTNIISANSASSDKFGTSSVASTIVNSLYNSSSKYYKTSTSATDIKNGDKIGTEVSNPISAFTNTSVPSTSSDIHSSLRNANGTINVNGLYEVKAGNEYAQLGAKFNVKSAVMTVNY